MPPRMLLASPFLFLIALSPLGCASSRHEVLRPSTPSPASGIIFAADGAGGFEATSIALREAVEASGAPLCVETFEWSHGFGRVLSDAISRRYIQEAGRQLACRVNAFRSSCPERAIYLVGHSAGAAVVLAASEALPPGSVEQIALLSPSVSQDYDLRPALRAARKGVDTFSSHRDWGYLGLAVLFVGTADGRWLCPAAGRVGFRPTLLAPEDAALYEKLRQHPWHPCMAWTGNHGGHYGGHHPEYLRAYVLPAMLQTP